MFIKRNVTYKAVADEVFGLSKKRNDHNQERKYLLNLEEKILIYMMICLVVF